MSDNNDYNGCSDLEKSVASLTSTSTNISTMGAFNPNRPNIELDVNGNTLITGDLLLNDANGSTVNVGELLKTLKTFGERLCVLQPDFEAHDQYPALKDAYEQYKMLEKLLLKGNKDVRKD